MIDKRGKLLSHRALLEDLQHRASLLSPSDRRLLEQVMFYGVPPHKVAVLTGGRPRTVQNRVRRLRRRLIHPEITFIIRNHSQWPPEMGHIAMAVWVRGERLRDIARDMGLSLHAVRQHVESVRGLVGDSAFGRPRRRMNRRRRARRTGV